MQLLQFIKQQTGLELSLCPHFTGVNAHNSKPYINVILPQRVSESSEYDLLKRFADKCKAISVEPNGLNRVAIFYPETL